MKAGKKKRLKIQVSASLPEQAVTMPAPIKAVGGAGGKRKLKLNIGVTAPTLSTPKKDPTAGIPEYQTNQNPRRLNNLSSGGSILPAASATVSRPLTNNASSLLDALEEELPTNLAMPNTMPAL